MTSDPHPPIPLQSLDLSLLPIQYHCGESGLTAQISVDSDFDLYSSVPQSSAEFEWLGFTIVEEMEPDSSYTLDVQ